MQGASIWGLVLALASLGRCTVQQIVGDAEIPDVVFSLSVQEGMKTLFDISLEDAQTKSLPASILNVVNRSLLVEKLEPLKKMSGLEKKNFFNVKNENVTKTRRRRQTRDLKIPILPQLYTGSDEVKSDICERHEVMHRDGECYELLSQGPCEDDEYVLMDYETKEGICAARLCSPDRVFVFEDQQCHDPFEMDICPPGRQLTTSCFGTPVCVCPDGTYEEEEDSEDEDVCQPILGKIESCSAGFVFWFDSFRNRPRCLPDPCAGINAKRGLDVMPYVPSVFDGKCYQIGQELPQCPSDTFYTLAFDRLKGICASLEDAGYLVADNEADFFARLYGPRTATTPSRSPAASKKRPKKATGGSGGSRAALVPKKKHLKPQHDEEAEEENGHEKALRTNRVVTTPKKAALKSSAPAVSEATRVYLQRLSRFLKNTKRSPRVSPAKRETENTEEQEIEEPEEEEEEEEESKHRQKRDSLPYASPSFVFEPALASCRAGAIRGFNNKCRSRILPSRTPLSRPRRNVRVEAPVPICPSRSFYSIRRRCVSNTGQIQAQLLAQGLG